jgi:hypothetical protein
VPPVEEVATLVVCYGDRPISEQLADDRFKVLPALTAPDTLRLCRFNHPDVLILDHLGATISAPTTTSRCPSPTPS